MTTTQFFFLLSGVMVTFGGILAAACKLCLDAKVDPIKRQLDMLVDYMDSHEGKISTL